MRIIESTQRPSMAKKKAGKGPLLSRCFLFFFFVNEPISTLLALLALLPRIGVSNSF